MAVGDKLFIADKQTLDQVKTTVDATKATTDTIKTNTDLIMAGVSGNNGTGTGTYGIFTPGIDVETVSWTPPPGVRRFWVTILGASGGGGGGYFSPTGGSGGGGGSGASGGTLIRYPVTVNDSEPIIITQGKAGVGGANGAPGTDGTPGGISSFGSYLSITGGKGGIGSRNSGYNGAGGVGTYDILTNTATYSNLTPTVTNTNYKENIPLLFYGRAGLPATSNVGGSGLSIELPSNSPLNALFQTFKVVTGITINYIASVSGKGGSSGTTSADGTSAVVFVEWGLE